MNRWTGVALWCVATASAAQPVPRLETDEPRAFGYQVGDLVQRQVALHLPDGWTLDADSIPRPGARGQPLELRRVERREQRESGGVRHELRLQYQVFFAPVQVRTFEMPPFRLALRGPAREEELRVEAWPVTVAPLVPVEVSPRNGLGEQRPDREPPFVDLSATQRRLVAWAALALLLAAGLGVIHLGLPWHARRHRPFGQAWPALKRLPPAADDAQWRAACRRLHDALDRSAGEVVFERSLERFVAARPGFAALRDDLQRFLQLSHREFFAGAPRAVDDARWLVALARRCRDAELES
jgi:mxaA protein